MIFHDDSGTSKNDRLHLNIHSFIFRLASNKTSSSSSSNSRNNSSRSSNIIWYGSKVESFNTVETVNLGKFSDFLIFFSRN